MKWVSRSPSVAASAFISATNRSRGISVRARVSAASLPETRKIQGEPAGLDPALRTLLHPPNPPRHWPVATRAAIAILPGPRGAGAVRPP